MNNPAMIAVYESERGSASADCGHTSDGCCDECVAYKGCTLDHKLIRNWDVCPLTYVHNQHHKHEHGYSHAYKGSLENHHTVND